MKLLKEIGGQRLYLKLAERPYTGPIPDGPSTMKNDDYLRDWLDLKSVGVIEVAVINEAGEPVGEATFTAHHSTKRLRFFEDESPAIEIDEQYRRLGIGSALVRTVQQVYGYRLTKPASFSEDGLAFWASLS